MTMKLSKLAALGVLSMLVGVSQSINLRGNEEAHSETKFISLEEITAKMVAKYGKETLDLPVEDGLRKLQCSGGEISCDGGGTPDYHITFGGRDWGSCQEMDPCLCGIAPMSMAFWCPYQCCPGCGGSCATPQKCPRGFNIDKGVVTPYEGKLPPPPYPYWPCNMGPACEWYANPGANTQPQGAQTSAPVGPITVEPTPAPVAADNAGTGSPVAPTPMPAIEGCLLPAIWC